MKKRVLQWSLAAGIIVLSFGMIGAIAAKVPDSGGKKDISPKFRAQLTEVVNEYLAIKDALGQSNAKTAALNAGKFIETLAKVKDDHLTKSDKKEWGERADKLRLKAQVIRVSTELEAQRLAFLALSSELTAGVQQFGPVGITLYKQNCPMALGKGGDWLSDSKEILNPFFGTDMPGCGEVTEVISPK